MTTVQIALIKKTWSALRGVDPVLVGELFYSRLFYTSPKLRKMFDGSMTGQYKKLIDMLNMMVARLDRMDEINDEIKQLAIRHKEYGVKESHYKPVGDALLWTLERGLGKDWNGEVKDAWSECYHMITRTMLAEAGK